MPITWLITAVLGFFAWGMDLLELTAYSIAGLFSSFEVLIIIFGAIVVMNTLKMSGGMVAINNGFRSISADAHVQAIIIGFLFVSFIEAAAGFGSPTDDEPGLSPGGSCGGCPDLRQRLRCLWRHRYTGGSGNRLPENHRPGVYR